VKLGVVFPQTEIGPDPGGVRAYAEAAESLGYDYIVAFDHVAGADLTNRPNWTGPYNLDSAFHEVFVLFGFLSGVTATIEFATGILILPQRQTVLAAKQAAALDVLSGGRFRLGVGVGWNPVEYDVLGENFGNRGVRSLEQVILMQRLWTERSVTFHGKYHTVDAVGILPMPVQQPIPVWFGGYKEATIRRIAQVGDGWMCTRGADDEVRRLLDLLDSEMEREGRIRSSVGIEGSIRFAAGQSEWEKTIDTWTELGATHLCLGTMGAGLNGAQAHIDAIRKFKEIMGPS
jgi:probable F420-dependent oxidoreductase